MTNLSVCSPASHFSCLGLPSLLIHQHPSPPCCASLQLPLCSSFHRWLQQHTSFFSYMRLFTVVFHCVCAGLQKWLLLRQVCWICLTWINVAAIDQSITCLISQAPLQSAHQIHLSACACMELLLIYPIYQFAHSSIYLLIQASQISALTFNPLHPYTGSSSLPSWWGWQSLLCIWSNTRNESSVCLLKVFRIRDWLLLTLLIPKLRPHFGLFLSDS